MQLPPNYGESYTTAFRNLFFQVAAASQVSHVPFLLKNVALDMSLMQADGLHPTAAAQPIILENIWPALLPLLQQETAVQ